MGYITLHVNPRAILAYILSLHSSTNRIMISCLSHVKRTRDSDGTLSSRPSAPGAAVFTEFTLDRSGSMSSYNGSQHEATKSLFDQQKTSAKETGAPHFFTVTTFDDEAKVYLDNVDAACAETPTDAQLAEMCDPRGCTRLYDTALQSVKRVEKRAREWYASQSPRFRRLVKFDQVTMTFMLFTDGYDNRSELDKDGKMLAEAIREFRAAGGTAIFMASNQDACSVGASLGFSRDTSLTVGTTPEYAELAFEGMTGLLREVSSGNRNIAVPTSLRQSSCPMHPIDDDDDDDAHSGPSLGRFSTTPSTSSAALSALNSPPPPVHPHNLRQPAFTPPQLRQPAVAPPPLRRHRNGGARILRA